MDPVLIERQLREVLRNAEPRIIAAYLFGSVARGTPHSKSDVDVGILYATRPEARLEELPVDLEADLQQAAKHPVQVVILNWAPADLVHRVLRDGKLLLNRDNHARAEFVLQRTMESLDLRPIIAEYRRARSVKS